MWLDCFPGSHHAYLPTYLGLRYVYAYYLLNTSSRKDQAIFPRKKKKKGRSVRLALECRTVHGYLESQGETLEGAPGMHAQQDKPPFQYAGRNNVCLPSERRVISDICMPW